MNIEEFNLVRRAKNGDALAFARLHDMYYPIVYRFFYYRVEDPGDVERLSSDLFIRVTEELGFFKPGGIPFKEWVYALAGDMLIEQSQGRVSGDQPEDRVFQQSEPGSGTTMDAAFLKRCLSRLNKDERELVIDRLIEERSSHMAAREINKSIRNTRMRQRHALSKLSQVIRKEGSRDEA
jgi:RNA polymerase sigma-70 factor (ECF subfamily)